MSSKPFAIKALLGAAALVGALSVAGQAQAAATIVINNLNAGTGIGFDDATPATPVGGNTGTTVGQQRLIAFTYAANIWGATLTSSVPIVINAQFTPLTCTATSAVLGSAGATQVTTNFPNAPVTNTWYSYALANRIAGVDTIPTTPPAAPNPQINARFNANLGSATGGNTNGTPTVPAAGCLTGTFFYYGLDGNHGTNTDFVAVLQHEMAHGLGFQTFTSGTTGAFLGTAPNQFPAIWDHFLFGTTAAKLWKDMTPAERVASAISVTGLVWTGANVTNAVPSVLRQGVASLTISGAGAGSAAGVYGVGEASFGAPIFGTMATAQIMPISDQGTGPGCSTFNEANIKAVFGRIALIDRGTCGFAVKAKNAQVAGAIGVVIANNAAGAAPGLGGSDPTVTIPTVSVSQADGLIIKSALRTRSRAASGVIATIGTTGTQYSGADLLGRAKMYAPNPFQSGSSVSHFDTTMFRNQLMEPAINGDLTQSVLPPQDLTYRLFQDIGWEVAPPAPTRAAR